MNRVSCFKVFGVSSLTFESQLFCVGMILLGWILNPNQVRSVLVFFGFSLTLDFLCLSRWRVLSTSASCWLRDPSVMTDMSSRIAYFEFKFANVYGLPEYGWHIKAIESIDETVHYCGFTASYGKVAVFLDATVQWDLTVCVFEISFWKVNLIVSVFCSEVYVATWSMSWSMFVRFLWTTPSLNNGSAKLNKWLRPLGLEENV